MMYAKDFRREAREALRGHWGQAVGVCFVAGLFAASVTGSAASFPSLTIRQDIEYVRSTLYTPEINYYIASPFNNAMLQAMASVLIAILLISFIWGLVCFFISGAVSLGCAEYNLVLLDNNDDARFSDLFSQFDLFWKGFGLMFMINLLVFLWTLLFIIPGIIAMYRYSMAYFILCENPDMGVMEAISASKELMKGYKFKAFCLNLSFIGWSFLCCFTFGIGFLWLAPYMAAATASFYRFVCDEKYEYTYDGPTGSGNYDPLNSNDSTYSSNYNY